MLSTYVNWLHGKWPAGTVEKGPRLKESGETSLAGVYVAGDLTGIPLLKYALDTGAKAVQQIATEPQFSSQRAETPNDVFDLVIIGAGVAGLAAAMEAREKGLRYILLEAAESLSTIRNFPIKKPIYTYPTEMVPAGTLQVNGDVKEELLEQIDAQVNQSNIDWVSFRADHIVKKPQALEVQGAMIEDGAAATFKALRIIIAIGRSGQYRKLGVPGEDLNKVSNRLHDPAEFSGRKVMVVGGGDTAIESALSLSESGALVILSYRKDRFSRPKQENLDQLNQRVKENPDTLRLELNTTVKEIQEESVVLHSSAGGAQKEENDALFVMIGRNAPLDFFRRSKIAIDGEWSKWNWLGLISFLMLCLFVYHWKSYYWFPHALLDPSRWVQIFGAWIGAPAQEKSTLLYTLLQSAQGPSFYYTLIYSSAIAIFGWRRIQRRKTPYVTVQTASLVFFQWLPLFILPELILPYMGRNGLFHDGAFLRSFADLFFETYDGGVGEERAYWRAYGFILAWPLMVYNWFTHQPIVGWLVLGFIQTFVLIPLLVYRYGKGAFCGWICSCGALAETLGDAHRQKMPHGPRWSRLNLLGQIILVIAILMMFGRVIGWIWPDSWIGINFQNLLDAKSPLTYKWIVDVGLAGFLGVGLYFHFSGRTWCRFACPLAALMHIYARFTQFRIFSDKKKCISCNMCTVNCHQGIDVMNFANKGLPMEDPQCVRCSACVQSCPTGVLQFGRMTGEGQIHYDSLPASLVQITERKK
jgi:NosR/NirI family transcriptional regulator, nitrous oxide reductase regulator